MVVVFHAVGVLSALHAVMFARTAQGAIAWGLSLVVLPYVAVPAYWVFGRRSFHGYVEAWRGRRGETGDVETAMRERLAPYAVEMPDTMPVYEPMRQLTGAPLLRGNDVELLVDGEATFESIFAGLAKARSYALVQFYTIRDDGLGRRLRDELIACVERGVRVWVLYDEVGSVALPRRFLDELSEGGIEHSGFNGKRGPRNRFQVNFRNHRKSVVVDGRVAWIGGHNVGDEYLGRDPKLGPWRDTHVRIEGPAALVAQAIFLADWSWARQSILDLDWRAEAAASGADVRAMVLPFAPTTRLEIAQLFFIQALNGARDRIWISTPYFVPDQGVLAALRLAALRGVDVRILVPDRSDIRTADLATRWFARELTDVDIRFFRYTEGLLHQKVLLIDDLPSVGTANFDNRSFRLQFEMNAVFVGGKPAREVEAMLRRDMERSVEWQPADLDEAALHRRLAVALARLAAPVL